MTSVQSSRTLGLGVTAGEPGAFDVHGPLPEGVTLLEASAGTGKTFTIETLVTRYVAEGVPLERLLVVTFTRMATGELRDRVRHRLVVTASALAHAIEGGQESSDPLVRLLAKGDRADSELKHSRLTNAIADFDAATIDTTHGFCLHMLMSLGVVGDVERGVTLVEDTSDLLEEVVDDLYVRRFWQGRDAPLFDISTAMEVAKAVAGNSAALVVPNLSDETSRPAMRRRLAKAAMQEMDRRKRVSGILTYDDLLTRLRAALTDAARGPAACRRLSGRYEVVLVDEFQDTDPVQWEILDLAFRRSTLVLIGDPKQAIYSFRGADVYAYLAAAESATRKATLSTNWRSDQGLIDAYDALFADSQLGHLGIAYHRVHASPESAGTGIVGAPSCIPLRIRVLDRRKVEVTRSGYAKSPEAQRHIAHDLASDIVALLCTGASLPVGRDAANKTFRPVGPGDVAVLVRTNRQAGSIRGALHDSGVPAVVAGGGSVFESAPATDWVRLLTAIDKPTSRRLAATAALTHFVGWSATRVASAGDEDWEDLHWRLARWSTALRGRGVAALLEQVSSAGLPARVLSLPSGERTLTDLFHVGRLLHSAAVEQDLGPAALIAWLRRRIAEAGEDRNDEDRSLRLESDAEAVQVLTIHRSKGLEFPIVYCPYLWDGYDMPVKVPVFHDPDNADALTVDVGGESVGFARHLQLHQQEQRGEDLRLMYVALTRARHQAVVWWAGATDSGKSPLGRLLFYRDIDGVVSSTGGRTPSDDQVRARLVELSESAGGCIGVESADGHEGATMPGSTASSPELAAAVFHRTFDERWRRTSYSGITADTHVPTVGSEPDERLVTDELPFPAESPFAAESGATTERESSTGSAMVQDSGQLGRIPLLLSAMPGGVEVGSFVHGVLESTDFAAADLDDELRVAIDAALARRSIDVGDRDLLVAGLRNAIDTPLGDVIDGMSLRQVARPDRLDEVTFELPLAGGENPCGTISMSDVAHVLRDHLAADDPVVGYADRLDDPTLTGNIRGYLTGSIDLVIRFSGHRLAIVDYKTNRLAPSATDLNAWHYRPEALSAEMDRAHYPLQAILYTVALHRYMRWRDPNYEAARDLSGVLYLFLRGMSSPMFPTVDSQPCGVWSWRPPARLIEELSDLFDKGTLG